MAKESAGLKMLCRVSPGRIQGSQAELEVTITLAWRWPVYQSGMKPSVRCQGNANGNHLFLPKPQQNNPVTALQRNAWTDRQTDRQSEVTAVIEGACWLQGHPACCPFPACHFHPPPLMGGSLFLASPPGSPSLGTYGKAGLVREHLETQCRATVSTPTYGKSEVSDHASWLRRIEGRMAGRTGDSGSVVYGPRWSSGSRLYFLKKPLPERTPQHQPPRKAAYL